MATRKEQLDLPVPRKVSSYPVLPEVPATALLYQVSRGVGFPARASLLRDSPMGPSSLSLHTSGGHIDNFDVRIPQAPVEAKAVAGAGPRVRGGDQGPSKQVQGGADIGTWKTRSQATI